MERVGPHVQMRPNRQNLAGALGTEYRVILSLPDFVTVSNYRIAPAREPNWQLIVVSSAIEAEGTRIEFPESTALS